MAIGRCLDLNITSSSVQHSPTPYNSTLAGLLRPMLKAFPQGCHFRDQPLYYRRKIRRARIVADDTAMGAVDGQRVTSPSRERGWVAIRQAAECGVGKRRLEASQISRRDGLAQRAAIVEVQLEPAV